MWSLMLTLERNRKCEITVFAGLVVISRSFLVCIVFYVDIVNIVSRWPCCETLITGYNWRIFHLDINICYKVNGDLSIKRCPQASLVKSQYTLGVYKTKYVKWCPVCLCILSLHVTNRRYFSHNETVKEGTGGILICRFNKIL